MRTCYKKLGVIWCFNFFFKFHKKITTLGFTVVHYSYQVIFNWRRFSPSNLIGLRNCSPRKIQANSRKVFNKPPLEPMPAWLRLVMRAASVAATDDAACAPRRPHTEDGDHGRGDVPPYHVRVWPHAASRVGPQPSDHGSETSDDAVTSPARPYIVANTGNKLSSGSIIIVGGRNEYQPKSGDVLLLGSKGRYGSCVGGR